MIPRIPNDRSYLQKQQALDFIEKLRKDKRPIFGLEVLRFNNGEWETTLYKSVWFKTQRGVHDAARNFVRHQMAGEWQFAELKLDESR